MSADRPIYMDNNATTPVDPAVVEAMLPYFSEEFGNAASDSHDFGRRARDAVDVARERVAGIIGAEPASIVWTSGATESDNLAIKGVAEMYGPEGPGRSGRRGNHIVTCKTEHKAVVDTCKYLESNGFEVTWLEPDSTGRLTAGQVEDSITDRTILITLMAANNEIGTLHPIMDIGEVARRHGVLFHCDATQAVGKIPIDVDVMGIDLLSLSAHKMYGPKGVGALFVRRRDPRVRLACQMHGGGHERGLRSGTLNVPGAVGFGAACEIAREKMPEEAPRLQALRDRLHEGLTARLEDIRLNGHPVERLPNTVNLSFAYVEGESMMMRMGDLAVSSGSACSSATLEASYVLKAIGVPDHLTHSAIRFSLGRFNTAGEADRAVERVVAAVTELRELSPLYDMVKQGIDLDKVKWTHTH